MREEDRIKISDGRLLTSITGDAPETEMRLLQAQWRLSRKTALVCSDVDRWLTSLLPVAWTRTTVKPKDR